MWFGLTIARSSPASTAWWRKTELSTARAGWPTPNETFETPSDVFTCGTSCFTEAGGPAGEDVAGRLERLVRRGPAGSRGAQLRLPPPRRRGRARPGDGQPEPHHPVQRDLRGGARARRRTRLQP